MQNGRQDAISTFFYTKNAFYMTMLYIHIVLCINCVLQKELAKQILFEEVDYVNVGKECNKHL